MLGHASHKHYVAKTEDNAPEPTDLILTTNYSYIIHATLNTLIYDVYTYTLMNNYEVLIAGTHF